MLISPKTLNQHLSAQNPLRKQVYFTASTLRNHLQNHEECITTPKQLRCGKVHHHDWSRTTSRLDVVIPALTGHQMYH